jgi:prevent-host-death family protein
MVRVTVQRAKRDLSGLIDRAREGEEVIIVRGTQSLVRLTPCVKNTRSRTPGRLRGKLNVGARFFEPLPKEELEAWQ